MDEKQRGAREIILIVFLILMNQKRG